MDVACTAAGRLHHRPRRVTGPDGSSHHGALTSLTYGSFPTSAWPRRPTRPSSALCSRQRWPRTGGRNPLSKGPVPATRAAVEPLPIGRWEELRKGRRSRVRDRRMVEVAKEAAERLEIQGLSARSSMRVAQARSIHEWWTGPVLTRSWSQSRTTSGVAASAVPCSKRWPTRPGRPRADAIAAGSVPAPGKAGDILTANG